MKNVNKYKNGEFSGDQLDQFTRKLVSAKICNDKKHRWKLLLEKEHGIKRNTASVFTFVRYKSVFLKVLGLAASLALFLIVGYLMTNSRTIAPAQLAEPYLKEPFPNSLSRKGAIDDTALRLQLIEAYNERDYPKAIESGKELSAHEKMQVSDYFFIGLSYLYNDDSQSAIVEFLTVRTFDDETTDFQQEASWFLALAYLKVDNLASAKKELKRIVEKKEWAFENAEKILEKIRK